MRCAGAEHKDGARPPRAGERWRITIAGYGSIPSNEWVLAHNAGWSYRRRSAFRALIFSPRIPANPFQTKEDGSASSRNKRPAYDNEYKKQDVGKHAS